MMMMMTMMMVRRGRRRVFPHILTRQAWRGGNGYRGYLENVGWYTRSFWSKDGQDDNYLHFYDDGEQGDIDADDDDDTRLEGGGEAWVDCENCGSC